jgi:hypothetical protein
MSDFTLVTKKSKNSSPSSSKHRVKNAQKARSLLSTQTASTSQDVEMKESLIDKKVDKVESGDEEMTGEDNFEIFGKRVSLIPTSTSKSNQIQVPSFPMELDSTIPTIEDGDGEESDDEEQDSRILIPTGTSSVSPTIPNPSESSNSNALSFPSISHTPTHSQTQKLKLSIPPHRMTPLKKNWEQIYRPLVGELGLSVRVLPSKRKLEMKVNPFFLLFHLKPY